VRQRSELEVSWNKEHASFLEAKKRRSQARVLLDVTKSTQNGLQGEVDEVRARIPAMSRTAKKIGKECEEATKKADMASEQADGAIASLSEARDDAEETTASCDKAESMDDKNDCVLRLGDSKKKVADATMLKTELVSKATERRRKTKLLCSNSVVSATSAKAAIRTEGDGVEAVTSSGSTLAMREAQIAAYTADMKRAKATAKLISDQLKELTVKIANLRSKVRGCGCECGCGCVDGRVDANLRDFSVIP
jgi:hypothetical protein